MRIEDILNTLEGNQGKQAYITLSDGTHISPICYGTKANDYGDLFVIVSDEKSKKSIPTSAIDAITFT